MWVFVSKACIVPDSSSGVMDGDDGKAAEFAIGDLPPKMKMLLSIDVEAWAARGEGEEFFSAVETC